MNNLNIPLNDFAIEAFTLDEFETIIFHKGLKDECISNVIKDRFDSSANLKIIDSKVIGNNIYFFLRWLDE